MSKESIIKILNAIFYNIDMFKFPVFLIANQKNKISSKAGIFFTLLIFTFIIYSLSHSNMILKINPSIYTQSFSMPLRENISLSSDFGFAIGLIDEKGNIYDYSKTLNINMDYFYIDRINQINEIINITFRNCNINDFPSNNNDFLHRFEYEKLKCLDQKNFNLFGYNDELKIKGLNLKIQLCENNTKNECLNYSAISNFLSTKIFSIFYYEKIFDLANYTHPFRYNLRTNYIPLNLGSFHQKFIFFKKMTLNQDDGFIFGNENSFLGYSEYNIENNIFPQNEYVKTLASVFIHTSQYSEFSQRSYPKLPETLGLLGGQINIMILIFNILVYFYIEIPVLNTFYKSLNQKKINKDNPKINNDKKEIKIELSKNYDSKFKDNQKNDNSFREIIIQNAEGLRSKNEKVMNVKIEMVHDFEFSFYQKIKLILKNILYLKLNDQELNLIKFRTKFEKEIDILRMVKRIKLLIDENKKNLNNEKNFNKKLT